MGDLSNSWPSKIVLGLISLGAAVVWFTWSGDPAGLEPASRLPASILGGGGGTLALELRVNRPATLKATFSAPASDDSPSGVSVEEGIPSGEHLRSVEVPEDTSVHLRLAIPDAEVGARIDWKVAYEGAQLADEQVILDAPLDRGRAFFVEFETESVERIREWATSR